MGLHQLIIDLILKSGSNSISGKLKEKTLLKFRDRLSKNGNALIEYNLNGRKILLPFSHDLPINRKIFPLYSENLGRIASYLTTKYYDLKVIDIGANIGDSVYIIKSRVDIPILCIEGDDYFFSILKKNISQWENVQTEKTFVGDKTESRGSYSYSKGSGRIVETGNSTENIKFENLFAIVTKNPVFENAKLIKIDTDGFDCRIIRSSLNYLSKSKPVLFFEYDPYLIQQLNDDGLSIFDSLSEIGYDTAIFYDNSGDYLLATELTEKIIIEDLHNYYSGRNIERYCDICVFHKNDEDIVLKIREKELKFFANERKFNLK